MVEQNNNDLVVEIASLDDSKSVCEHLSTSPDGLTTSEVQQRQSKFGKNVLAKVKTESLFHKFIGNFTSTMAILLWIAGIIAFGAHLVELGIAIWAVNVINGFSVFGKSIKLVKQPMHWKICSLLIQGLFVMARKKILVAELVPGDIVKLEEGDDIPADIRLLQSTDVQVDQSALTGEVNPINKTSHDIDPAHKNHSDFGNFIFSGTSMMKGDATGVVVKTGMETDFGQIAKLTQNVQQDQSPLEKELSTLTKQISILAVSVGLVFFLVATFFVHYPLIKSFVFALGMIVAFIPEGLEPTVTLSLAGAVQRMAKHHALVKKLSSVETLGTASVICSDKTGTLTKNEMTVQQLWTTKRDYQVSGEGYAAQGTISAGPDQLTANDNNTLKELLLGGMFADNAKIVPPAPGQHRYQILGDPTEACLEVVARKGKIDVDKERKNNPRAKELPFDSDRKMMTVILSKKGHYFDTYTKGAPNCVITQCTQYLHDGKIEPLTDDIKQRIMDANDNYVKQGLRVLAVAGRDLPSSLKDDLVSATISNVEQSLTFIGLSVMMDPPRPEVYKAAQECRDAHIQCIMITGDYSLTAKSIARKIGLTDPNKPLAVVTGDQLQSMNNDELKEVLKGEVVFARMAPEQKYRIVSVLQEMGKIVAVTGDGVNDAPALKKDDIGIAMGQRVRMSLKNLPI